MSGRTLAAQAGGGLRALSPAGQAQLIGAGAGTYKQVIHTQGEVNSLGEAQASEAEQRGTGLRAFRLSAL